MSELATVSAQIDPELKVRVEHILSELGLTPSEAIALFYEQVEYREGLPFDIVLPNETTRRTFEDTDAGRNLVVCKDAEDMFEKLGI
ncbi:MAG: type II toxin-antitoxin system RelB/DinJ family antitoxin [Chloroflexi bacterium]|nr:type II toxin-antitoxin system RelB/DinJ family antitoxin [Chloroflexota bacterium]